MKSLKAMILVGLLATTGFSLFQTTLLAAQRPISDFLSRQGKFCVQLDASGNFDCAASHYVSDTTGGGCLLFVPPVANYTGWTSPDGPTSAAFDYAGLANVALGGRLGTTVNGSVHEIPQPDGSAIVKVILQTRNAMAFAVAGFDFNGPLLFGNRVAEILGGAPPSVGSCTLTVTFRNSAPGADLPDLEELFICRFADLLFISFVGQSDGLLPNGHSGRMEVTQKGLIQDYFRANPNSRVALDAFPAEHIHIRQTGR